MTHITHNNNIVFHYFGGHIIDNHTLVGSINITEMDGSVGTLHTLLTITMSFSITSVDTPSITTDLLVVITSLKWIEV